MRRPAQLALAALLSAALSQSPAAAQPSIEADAETVMRAMAEHLGQLTAFSVAFETDGEIVDLAGQKLMFVSAGRIVLQRPDRILVKKANALGEAELRYDGSTLSIYAPDAKAYFLLPVAGTLDDAIDAVRSELGYDAPGADLLYADVYASLMSNVTSGRHLGMALIDGVECHHLAFRTDLVDWQLWVTAGDRPLPLRYIITSKWVTGAPQYTARLHDWNMAPSVDQASFAFTAPADARQIEQLRVNAVGELEEVPR